MNHAQREFLKRFGVSTPQELPNPSRKLEFCELERVPDPEPDDDLAPPMSAAAKQWLGDRPLDSLSEESRKLFDWMNSDPMFRPTPDTPKAAPRTINTAKLIALPPEQRLAVARAIETIEAARRERAAGCDPRIVRVTDAELQRALQYCAPHWSDEC